MSCHSSFRRQGETSSYVHTPEDKERLAKAVCKIEDEKRAATKASSNDPDADWLEGTQADRAIAANQKHDVEEVKTKKKRKHKRPQSREKTAERSKSVTPKPCPPVTTLTSRPDIGEDDSCTVSAMSQCSLDDNANNSNINSAGLSVIHQRCSESTVPTLPVISQLKAEGTAKPGRSRDRSECSTSTETFSYTDASFELSESDEESGSEEERLPEQTGEYIYPDAASDEDIDNSVTTFYELSCRVHHDKDSDDDDLDAPSDTKLLQTGLDLNQSYLHQFEGNRGSTFERGPFYEEMLDVPQLKTKLLLPEKYKRCTIQIEGAHLATCIPIDADSKITSVEISGRSKAGQVFNEDEVVVELLDGEHEKKDKRFGRVLGTLNRRLKNVKHPVFVCALDDKEAHLVRPMCKTLPKIHIMNKEIMETCPKLKKYKVELYDYDHRNGTLEFSQIVDVHPSNRDKYIFLVAYINWNPLYVYPRGAVLKILPYGDTLKTGLKILDLQHEVPMLYKISTVKKLESVARRLGDEPHNSLLKGRTDLTKLTTFTIDPPGSQDLDDALSIDSRSDGYGYRVGVHIADVAAYVEKGDPIDIEAQERAVTFYPGIKQPRTMLPEPLSNNIISLVPGKKRLTITVFFYLDSQGRRVQMQGNNFEIRTSVISSCRKFTYSEVQAIIITEASTVDTEAVSRDLRRLFKMAHEIRKRRLGNSMYHLDLDAADAEVDDSLNDTLEAHHLVEEFMIMANQQIAQCLLRKFGQTVPLRCQPPPSKESMEAFVKNEGTILDVVLCLQDRQISDYKKPCLDTVLETKSERCVYVQKWLWHAIESGKEGSSKFVKMDDHHPLQYLAYSHWLAIQERAGYRCSGSIKTSADGKHYSLDMYPYTHFTSPIRRYIDVVVHRQIHDMLSGKACSYKQAEVEHVCLHVNSIMKRSKAYQESCKALQKAIELKSNPKMINSFIDVVSDRGLSLCAPEMKHVSKSFREVKFNLLNMGIKPEVSTNVQTGCDTVTATWRKRLYDTKGFSLNTSESKEDRVRVLNQHPEAMFVPMHNWARLLRCSVEGLLDLRTSAKHARALERGTGLDDVSTECKDSLKMKPNTKFSMAFTHGQMVKVQMTAEPQKGILSPRPQMYNMTRNVQCCLQHMQDPVLRLTEYSIKYTQKSYKDAKIYIEKWIPLIEMEAATGAVSNEESCNINNLPIKFSGRKGTFTLPLSFCDVRNIELSGMMDEEENGSEVCSKSNGTESYDWLCLKYTMMAREMKQVTSKCTVPTTNKVWVGHAQVSSVKRKKENTPSENSQEGKIRVTFNLHRLAPDLPSGILGMKSPKFNVEILSKAEVDRRTESFLKQLPSTSCSLAQRIALNNAPIPHLDTEHKHEADSIERDLYIPDNVEDWRKRPLPRNNRKQQEAIDKALKSRFSLIQGPPGTGKTYTGIKLLYLFDKINSNWAKQGNPRKQVLFCGPSNKSVDLVARWMLNRLGDLRPDIVRVYGRLIEATDFPNPGRTFLTKSCTRSAKADDELSSIALHHLIRQKVKPFAEEINAIDRQFKASGYETNPKLVKRYVHLVREASIAEIRKHDVILCTTAVGSNPKVLEATNVFQVIIDEAGMCPEPHCLVPIIATKAEQVVLIGDHKQLQPIIKCKQAKDLGLATSLFERYALCRTSKNVEFTMLNKQYRMNPQICRFPSEQFYDGKLETGLGPWMRETLSIWPRGESRGRSGGDYPHVMMHVEGEEKVMTVSAEEGNEHSVSNAQEVELVVKLYRHMSEDESVQHHQVNIISQYNAQCHEIREALKKERLVNFNVNTVVSSQGGEWDYVIFSTVRSLPEYKIERNPTLGWCTSNMGFITDPHQINVALTRARKGLIIVGWMLNRLGDLRPDIVRVYGRLIEATDFPNPGRTFLTKSCTRSAKADDELSSIALHHLIRQKGKPFAEEINAIDRQFKASGYETNPKLVKRYVHLVREASIAEIRKHDVILCTTAVGSNPKVLEATNVFQVIIDEAGMCPEPHCLVPIIATKAEQVVLIGDHKQLQPIIKCKQAKDLGLATSLFERYALCRTSKNVEFTMLKKQYRMNPQICRFPSEQFYDGKLETGLGPWMRETLSIWPRGESQGRSGGDYPHVMMHVEGEEKVMTVSAEEGNEHSVSNAQEVELVVKLYRHMSEDESVQHHQVNIISQYNAQCHEIREALKKERLVNFNVNTVVSSQGGEWDYVIFSTVRSLPEYKIERNPTLGWCTSNMGFITDPHQINVALTRARKGLIIVGNMNLLKCDKVFGRLIRHYEKCGCIKTAENFHQRRHGNRKCRRQLEAMRKSKHIYGDERFESGKGQATFYEAGPLEEFRPAPRQQRQRGQGQQNMARNVATG